MAIFFASSKSGAWILCAPAVVASKTMSKVSFCLSKPSIPSLVSRQTLLARPRQALRIRNDAGHDHRTQEVTSLELVHEIRADIAGTQDRYRCFSITIPQSKII